MMERLGRAWRALVDAPQPPGQRGELVMTGPLPPWLYATLAAEAQRRGRPLIDIIYQAIYTHGLAILRHQAEMRGTKHEQ